MYRLIFILFLFLFPILINASELSREQRAAIESRIHPAGKVCLLGQTDCGDDIDSKVSTNISAVSSGNKTRNTSVSTLNGNCNIELEAGDSLQFSLESISVPASCSEISVTLTHTGNMPATAMGHNWVLSKEEDVAGIASDGANAGMDNEYVKSGDARVIAATAIIGGGESAEVTFSADKLDPGSEYTFFCSFPGHSFVMRGTFRIT